MHAYCYASGLIGFGAKIPDGALPIIHGPAKRVREIIEATSRHAYDGKALLVPGVPEEKDQVKAVEALKKYRDWIEPRLRDAPVIYPRLLNSLHLRVPDIDNVGASLLAVLIEPQKGRCIAYYGLVKLPMTSHRLYEKSRNIKASRIMACGSKLSFEMAKTFFPSIDRKSYND